MPIHLAIESVLKGKSPGIVITDDPVKPRAAFILIGRRCFLLGSWSDITFCEEIGDCLSEPCLLEAAGSGPGLFLLYYSPSIRENEIKKLFGRWEPKFRLRQYLTLEPGRKTKEFPLPAGFSLHFVSYKLINRTKLNNVDILSEEILSEAPSIKHFIDNCFGICARYKNSLIGWCLSEYNLEGKCEVGIETLRPYQRQGLASAMVSALMREAENRGFKQVGWHSYKDNKASTATAEKVGFVKVVEYSVCILELPKSSH
jgi:RimJ/RimL family protein N-acetyltransferase